MSRVVKKGRPTLSGGGGARFRIGEEKLLADLRRVGREVGGKILSSGDFAQRGRYSRNCICRRFGSWKAAVARVGLEPAHLNGVRREELLGDILLVARGRRQLRAMEYARRGKYSLKAVYRLFGRWQSACEAAGLEPVIRRPLNERELFLDFRGVWERLGRRPTYEEMKPPLSKFGVTAYTNRFGTFNKFVKVFLRWQAGIYLERAAVRRGPRTVNLRLRFAVLSRDRFRCCACGRSPATEAGVRLQVDHVLAWSKGGATELGNLQTLCRECNLGKSDGS